MGCDARWPKEEFDIVQLEFDLGNQCHTFLRATGRCPTLAYCVKGGAWDNCQVTKEWNYDNPT
jgi:hypothetical protein